MADVLAPDITDPAWLRLRLNDLYAIYTEGTTEIETQTLDAKERVRFANPNLLLAAIRDIERRLINLTGHRPRVALAATCKGLR